MHRFQLGFKLLFALAGDTGGGKGPRFTDFIQQDDLGGRIILENQSFEFGMGDVRHKTFAHNGDGLSFQSFQTGRLLNHFHGAASDGRHYGIISAAFTLGGVEARLYFAGFVANNTLVLGINQVLAQ